MPDSCCLDGFQRALLRRRPGLEVAKRMPETDPHSSAAGVAGARASGGNMSCSSDGTPLSKRQQKKQVLRDARQERRGQKRFQRQAQALDAALTAITSALVRFRSEPGLPVSTVQPERALRMELSQLFGVCASYQQLPMAFGPMLSEGLVAMGAAIVRPPKYSEKFLPQEYSLLHKVWTLLDGHGSRAGVVDIGAGNANCAVLAASLLGLTVICVERESPRIELRAEAQLPLELQARVIRLESDVADFGLEMLREIAAAHGLDRFVLVAKHPCGIGVDRSIDCAARLASEAAQGPHVVGAVLATCCTNKISCDDARVSRVSEFCRLYRQALPQPSQELESAVEIMSRCTAWRTACKSEGNAIGDEQRDWAEVFEDAVQAPRLRRLREVFGAAAEVRFAPHSCTLQDRCLLAGANPLPPQLWGDGDGEHGLTFVATLRASVNALLNQHGPIDCRPKGLKSARYDFDFRSMPLEPPED